MIRLFPVFLLCACAAGPTPAAIWTRDMATAVREQDQLAQLQLWRERHQAAEGWDPVALVGLARTLRRTGQPEVAARVLSAGDLRLEGASGSVALELARTEQVLGRQEQALLILERVVVCADRPRGAWLELARAQLRAGQVARAVKAATSAVREQPHRVDALDLLVLCAAQGNDPLIEYDALVRRMGLGGMDVLHLIRLAELAHSLGDQRPRGLEREISALERAIERDPQCARAHRMLGNIALSTQDHGRALVYFERAAELDPGNQALLFEYANCLDTVGQEERARQTREHARRLPNSDE
ncbi:MAG: tetratricopeptide repeat protein [bacterium]